MHLSNLDNQRWIWTESHKLKNKGTNQEIPGEWFVPEPVDANHPIYIEKDHNVKVLWITENLEDHDDIESGLDVSVIKLDPHEEWERVEALPQDEDGFFKIVNPGTNLFLTGLLNDGHEELQLQKEIDGKFKVTHMVKYFKFIFRNHLLLDSSLYKREYNHLVLNTD